MNYHLELTFILCFELILLSISVFPSKYSKDIITTSHLWHSFLILRSLQKIIKFQTNLLEQAASFLPHIALAIITLLVAFFSDNFYLFLQGLLLIVLYHFVCEHQISTLAEKKQQLQSLKNEINEKRNSPTRSSLMGLNPIRNRMSSFADEDNWLDMVDQGYFILRKDFSISLINKKGLAILREFESSFSELADRLQEVDEPKRSLKTIIKNIVFDAPEGECAKATLGYTGETQSKLRVDLFINYKARLVKLQRGCVLCVLKEKNESSNIMLAEKVSKITNCTISHELKTLLNGIIGNLELIEESIKQEFRLHYRVALSSSHILSSRLNDLLDFMQIQINGLKIHFNEFEIDEFIKNIAAICEWQAEPKHIAFQLNKDKTLPPTMIGDKTRIQQVLLNILNKAIEFTDYGTIKLSVYPHNGRFIGFKVISEGSGTHNRLWSQIANSSPVSRMERYTLIEGSATQNIEEMYLEISQLICRQMGTKITIESTENGSYELSFLLRDGFPYANSPNMIKSLVKDRRYSIHDKSNNSPHGNGKSTFERTQYGVEGVLQCKNINIINVSVSPPHVNSPLIMGSVQKVINAISWDSECEELPLEAEADFRTLSSHCLSPQKMHRASDSLSNSKGSLGNIPNMNSHTSKEFDSDISCTPPIINDSTYVHSQFLPESSTFRHTRTTKHKREKTKRKTMSESTRTLYKFGRKLEHVEADDCQHVLIVDDNSTNRLVLKSLLRKTGQNSLEANNGLEAAQVIEKCLYNRKIHELKLIFMDLQMPIMDGIKSTKTIRSLCSNTGFEAPPIIGISSDISEEDRTNFFQAGITEFYNKPIHREQIVKLVDKYMK